MPITPITASAPTGSDPTFQVKIRRWIALLVFTLAAILAVSALQIAAAHPEDEFCTPGGGMDPELCRALAALDRDTGQLAPLGDVEIFDRSWSENLWFYLQRGVFHILPGGYDHILFVLALFFSVRQFRPLLVQISLFTVAHTATLGLAATGLVNVPASIVEPLIAASIAVVAVETIIFKDISRWRPLIVFGFGLFHGLGFAGFFLGIGLPDDLFWSSLIGFNIGVEIGQIAVVVVAWLLLFWAMNSSWYRSAIVIPASALIAIAGAWWAISRTFGLG